MNNELKFLEACESVHEDNLADVDAPVRDQLIADWIRWNAEDLWDAFLPDGLKSSQDAAIRALANDLANAFEYQHSRDESLKTFAEAFYFAVQRTAEKNINDRQGGKHAA